MSHEVRIPDIEIVVSAANWEVSVVAFYADPDIHDGFHVIAAVDQHTTPAVIREVLQEAIKALGANDWKSLAELGSTSGADGEPLPF